jgi:hypothetical protein
LSSNSSITKRKEKKRELFSSSSSVISSVVLNDSDWEDEAQERDTGPQRSREWKGGMEDPGACPRGAR